MDRRSTMRPRQASQPQPATTPAVAPQPAQRYAARVSKKKRSVVVGCIMALTVLLLSLLVWWNMSSGGVVPRSDRYQAVFLDNGQVFFGKLKNIHGPYLHLEKAYYTKKAEVPADATATQKQATSSNISLVKVGDEVYGPENSMTIRAEQLLFWQDLSTDSKVTKAIDNAKN